LVLLKGGKEVAIIDTKTNKRVRMPTGAYDVMVKDKPDGVEVKTDKVVVSRGEEVLVRIEYVAKAKPVAVRPQEKATTIQVKQRLRWAGDAAWWHTELAPDGRYFLAVRGLT